LGNPLKERLERPLATHVSATIQSTDQPSERPSPGTPRQHGVKDHDIPSVAAHTRHLLNSPAGGAVREVVQQSEAPDPVEETVAKWECIGRGNDGWSIALSVRSRIFL
jgi:hypothetical protein